MRINRLWRQWREALSPVDERLPRALAPANPESILPIDISPADPLLAYFQNTPGVVEISKLRLDSPALRTLQAAQVQLVAPLVSQGQLIGLLNLGPRKSEQDYSSDDRRMLNNLASQAAPAVRVAQLVQQQQLEARQLERIEQELRVARIVQETLLPRGVPELVGWQLATYWQPARAIGGDFYDFIGLPDGQIAIVIADVTDKGVPAALVMASTRSILRGAAERINSPGQVLKRVNDLLYPEMPPKMFVTCLYAIFNPTSGRFWFANAGHNLPSQRTTAGTRELLARGMPLGLMPNMEYEENETILAPGDTILLYSDGLIEAHNPQREMFGFGRLHQLLESFPGDAHAHPLLEWLRKQLEEFTGPEWEQEDDVTLVMVERMPLPQPLLSAPQLEEEASETLRPLAEFTIGSAPGNERVVTDRVATLVSQTLELPASQMERLKTAVAETAMNAMEHGNRFQAELPTQVQILYSASRLVIRITDQGGGRPIPPASTPDLEAKLAGLQSPRGWGLFLIKSMVDDMHLQTDDTHHTVELIFKRSA